MKQIKVLVFCLVLSGCISVPLKPVAYQAESNVKSDITAQIELQTGLVSGSRGTVTILPIPGGVIPIVTGPARNLYFNEEDQLIFVNFLSSELDRLRILNFIETDNNVSRAAQVNISIFFKQTHHYPNHKYTLDVVMKIEKSGKSFENNYQINSSDGDSWWERINTNASKGKTKAADKLIKKIIPDIERWVQKQ